MPRQARLSRGDVVEAAVRVARLEGPDAVTIRRVATEVAATPMALYRHVRDRDDLLQAVVDAAGPAGDLSAVVDPNAPWLEQLRSAAFAIYERAHAEAVILALAVRNGITASWEQLVAEQLSAIVRLGGATPGLAAALARFTATAMTSLVLAEIWGRMPDDAVWESRRAAFLATAARLPPVSTVRQAAEDLFPASREHLATEFANFVVIAAAGAVAAESGH